MTKGDTFSYRNLGGFCICYPHHVHFKMESPSYIYFLPYAEFPPPQTPSLTLDDTHNPDRIELLESQLEKEISITLSCKASGQ